MRPLSRQPGKLTTQTKGLPALTCRASADFAPLSADMSKSSLRKLSKAQLMNYAQQMGIEGAGTKNTLVDRLLALSFTETSAHQLATDDRQGEMQKLQAEVAQLDLKLVAVSDTLAEATVAREDERQQLASVVAGMSSLREKWQIDVQQVEELATVAGQLEQSERDILTLRSQQGRFEERIAMMQHLLEERAVEVLILKAQLAGFRQPVLALAGAATAGYGTTTWDAETAAAEPARSSYSSANWANNWNRAVVRNNESSLMELDSKAQAVSAVQPATLYSPARASVRREHTTPGLAIVAAVAAAAQKGGAAWNSVKSLLPQDKRFIADAVLAAGTTALLYSIYN